MKLLWEQKHNWWVEDFKYTLKDIYDIKLLIRKHPDDSIGVIFKDVLKTLQWELEDLQKGYKKIYGTRFGLKKLREDIENATRNK